MAGAAESSKRQPFQSMESHLEFSTEGLTERRAGGLELAAFASNWPRDGSAAPVAARNQKRGCSSAGRAPDLHSGGRRFDPDQLHQFG